MKTETPLMKQYAEMKKKHPDAILLFRVGDFYETFSDDAIAASEILGITLTRRGNGAATSVELAGFPHHALDSYLPKLVRAGRRVAICEQLEDPKLAKKLVKRGITELVTPGVNLNDSTLPPKENNFLGGLHFMRPDRDGHIIVGVAFLDVTTGEFLCAQGDAAFVDKLLTSIAPKETLRMRGTRAVCESLFPSHRSVYNEQEDWIYTPESARERLCRQFGTETLKGFGVDHLEAAVIAAGSLLHYLDFTSHTHTRHITSLGRIDSGVYMHLDKFTMRNLELLDSAAEDGMSLIDVLDHTVTPMGSRMLKRWVAMPLLDIKKITKRQDCVEHFFRDPELRESLTERLRRVGDLSRLGGRLSSQRLGPKDLQALALSLSEMAMVRKELASTGCEPLDALGATIDPCPDAVADIRATIVADPPASVAKGHYIASGVNAELDRLRDIASNSNRTLQQILEREIAATGITSLKISYNNVHGYYIEVRNTHKDKVPSTWVRRQTLVGAERYITPELKQCESDILNARDNIESLERQEYVALLERLTRGIAPILHNADVAAALDCYLSLADVAEQYRYARPVLDDSLTLSITEGRHPVIERRLPPGEAYVANSVTLDCDKQQIMMITGPNMSGKSALLRQTALIALMAQTGSFVPADSARIGVIDRIMTRVGASDNISAGESTFMVEMNEAAAILNNMTPRSLILFDELGRGTSTYDGISIAWAIVEHIHENGRTRPKTLFATHYHELNEMERSFPRVANYNVSVSELDGKVVFMRKLKRGGSEHSFGIHVARLAGMPPAIVRRAEQVLARLEESAASAGTSGSSVTAGSSPAAGRTASGSASAGSGKAPKRASRPDMSRIAAPAADGVQLSIFQLDDPLLSQLRDRLLDLTIDNLTPLQALTELHELQSLLRGHD
ncbi:MAG: DNA mismatch repair protein MutS [Muribaculaceae bacterium]|nr:DNA mismatch repair protein MutS [Muribaculaceae bacterium]